MTLATFLRRRLIGSGLTSVIVAAVTVTKGASGLAPLRVFFNAAATTSTAASRPYHECLFLWNFGDASAPNWTTGGRLQSSNVDMGPLASHVYRTAGTYTPTCMIYDGTSAAVWIGTPIVVASNVAPAVWAGTNTILVSTSSTFTCAGVSGAQTLTTWDAAVTAFNTVCASGSGAGRILIRAGEIPDAISLAAGLTSIGGPIWIGTYDNAGPKVGGTKATIRATAGGVAGHGTGVVMLGNGPLVGHQAMNDVRFTDITFDTSLVPWPTTSYSVTCYGQWKDALFLDCPMVGATQTGIDISGTRFSGDPNFKARGYTVPTDVSFVGMAQSGQDLVNDGPLLSWGYVLGKNIAIQGCTADAKQGVGASGSISHCIRVLNHENLIVSHNDLIRAGSQRHALKMHSGGIYRWGIGPAHPTYSSTINSGKGDFTRPTDPVGGAHQLSDVRPQVWRCTTAGTAGGVEPTWNYTAGSTTADGSVVWTECTAGFYAGTTVPSDDLMLRDMTFGVEQFYSSQSVVADNKYGPTTSGWVNSIGAQDGLSFELCYDVLLDSNWLTGCASNVAAFVESTGTRRMTIRNSLLDMSGGSSITVVLLTTRSPSLNCYVAHDTWFYNNTIVCTSTSSANLYAMAVDAITQNPVAKNNLFYNTSGKTAAMFSGTANPSFPIVSDHNTGDVGTFATDPKFSGVLSAVAGWRITDATSYTRNVGASVPVWQDFFGTTRVAGAMDIGASEQ